MNAAAFWVTAAGFALLAFAGVCWSGLWRGWAQSGSLRSFPITFFPGFGLVLVFGGLFETFPLWLSSVCLLISIVACLLGMLLGIWDPDWWGPRWFREYKKVFSKGLGGGFEWMAHDPCRPGETSVEATQRHLSASRPVPPHKNVLFVSGPSDQLQKSQIGSLFFYPQAPVLMTAVEGQRESLKTIIPAEEITGAERVRTGDLPKGTEGTASGLRLRRPLRIDTTSGPWVFAAVKAGYVARQMRQRYAGTSQEAVASVNTVSQRPTQGQPEPGSRVYTDLGIPAGWAAGDDSHEAIYTFEGDASSVASRVGRVVGNEPRSLDVDHDAAEPGSWEVSKYIRSGFANMNPARVTVRISPAGDGKSVVRIRGIAKEGLIKQHAGRKAVERVAEELDHQSANDEAQK